MKNILVLFWLFPPTNLLCQSLIPDIDFPVSNGKLIYDPATRSVMLAGGAYMIPDSMVSNVWSWNGQQWKRTNASGPGSRDFFRSAVHSKTGISYFYGGMIEDGIRLTSGVFSHTINKIIFPCCLSFVFI